LSGTTSSICAPQKGRERVDVIYRRIDDDFIDPLAFNPDVDARRAGPDQRPIPQGNVALANAVGTGVADDKAIYSYVPQLVRYYHGRGPDSPQCDRHGGAAMTRQRSAMCSINLTGLVVKEVDGSGGYGMLIGPHSAPRQQLRRIPAAQAESAPAKTIIAQPTLALVDLPALLCERRQSKPAMSICGRTSC
jgi:uncharacterized circularly permuted ATP-grasp superfamily protein